MPTITSSDSTRRSSVAQWNPAKSIAKLGRFFAFNRRTLSRSLTVWVRINNIQAFCWNTIIAGEVTQENLERSGKRRESMTDPGAIILCGGQSTRMGRDKALLPFGPDETLLQRVVRIVAEVVDEARMICVAGTEQELPELPPQVRVVRDRLPCQGPLEGLAVGLSALAGEAEVAFVTACDVPFLNASLVRELLAMLDEHYDAVVPQEPERLHPLTAVYRTALWPEIERLQSAQHDRLLDLVAAVRTRLVTAADFSSAADMHEALRNCNRPEDYEAALRRAGFDE